MIVPQAMWSLAIVSLFASTAAYVSNITSLPTPGDHCKCFPGDPCWPSVKDWSDFNATVGGRLIQTIPIGSPCHDPHYNETQCETLKAKWRISTTHISSSSSVQAAIFANASCDPFSPRSSPCLLGNYVRYAVNVSSAADIASTMRFAEERNIRLVIRNTGHDYMGRSTGAGALAIWTHYLKATEIKDWSDDEYTGKAIKIGAGVQGFEVLSAAAKAGLVVVTGECPSVGIAGGYTQSGGHSALSTAFGLSADNTLEFEVVLVDGSLVTASASSAEHADLFWALSGSGSGNFGVVVSVTLRAHPDAMTSGASFTITAAPEALDAWHTALPGIISSGVQSTYAAQQGDVLWVQSLTAFHLPRTALEAILSPFVNEVAALGITLLVNYTQFDSYHDHYAHYFGSTPEGVFGVAESDLMGGRLLPTHLLRTGDPTIKQAVRMGATFVAQAIDVSRFASERRAVLPQWRDAIVMSALLLPFSPTAPFAEMQALQDSITNTLMPMMEAVYPGTGAYINEADFQQRNWQEVFYGANYRRLLEVKRKYDSRELLYNAIAVGSEGWKVREDGRMCAA